MPFEQQQIVSIPCVDMILYCRQHLYNDNGNRVPHKYSRICARNSQTWLIVSMLHACYKLKSQNIPFQKFHKYHVNVESETISCIRNTNCIYYLVEMYAMFELTTEFVCMPVFVRVREFWIRSPNEFHSLLLWLWALCILSCLQTLTKYTGIGGVVAAEAEAEASVPWFCTFI